MNSKTILLIEDNPDDVTLILRTLNKSHINYHVVTVGDGAEALDYLFREGAFKDPSRSPEPNLVLLDLKLPKVDGLDVLKSIRSREETKEIPVVILTTSTHEEDIIKSYEGGSNFYITNEVFL